MPLSLVENFEEQQQKKVFRLVILNIEWFGGQKDENH